MNYVAVRRILLPVIAIVLVAVPVTQASRTPAPVRSHLSAAMTAKPRLMLQPNVVAAGGRLTLIGSGFGGNERVWLGVGPPQSEALFWGWARANRSGSFRKTLTVKPHIKPGRWVAIACQRGCRIKAGASFRSIKGRG